MRSSEKKRLRLTGIPGTLGIYGVPDTSSANIDRVRLVMDKSRDTESMAHAGALASILLDVGHTSVVGRLAGRWECA